jgi:hypothetical protein
MDGIYSCGTVSGAAAKKALARHGVRSTGSLALPGGTEPLLRLSGRRPKWRCCRTAGEHQHRRPAAVAHLPECCCRFRNKPAGRDRGEEQRLESSLLASLSCRPSWQPRTCKCRGRRGRAWAADGFPCFFQAWRGARAPLGALTHDRPIIRLRWPQHGRHKLCGAGGQLHGRSSPGGARSRRPLEGRQS